MHQKEETFQVIIDVIKNSTCFKAFTISAEVPKIFMQQFWYTVKKVKDTESYEFLLANKRCVVDAEVFRKILNICPRVEGEEFTELQDDDATLTFLINLGYKAIINKCISRKTVSNDRLRKSRIDILWGMFYKENVNYPELIWEDFAFPIDHRIEKKSRREICHSPNSLKIGEDYQEYGLLILKTMLTEAIKRSESYQMFIKYSTGQIPPKKSRGKGTGDSSEGTGASPGVPDEFTLIPATSSEGTGTKPGVPDEEKVTSEANIILSGDLNKKVNDEETDDEFVHGEEHVQDDDEETDDEFVHGDEQVNDNKDEEMTNAEVEESGNGDEEVIDATKVDAGNTKEVNDEAKKAELPPISSSLSVSSGFGDQILKLLSDTSLIALEPSMIQTSTINLEQESKKSALEIRKIKKEQVKKQKMPKYTIKSTDKATLDSCMDMSNIARKQNPANHALYHALMEALIEDENGMDKGVADIVKNHKRQHDDDEDDDKDHSAGPNQGKKTKKKRTKESESFMKPSTTKETSKGKAPTKSSKTDKSITTHELIEEPIAEVVMDDQETTENEDVVNDVDRPQDNVAPKTNKPSKDTWFKQPPRPPTHDPKLNKRQVVVDQPEQPWFNKMIDNLTQEILVGPVYNLLKGTCTSSIELEYNMEKCFKALTDRLNCNNPEGDRCPFNLIKPLPLKGCLGHLTVAAEYFFNNNLEFLKSSDPEKKYTTSITKTKAARYEIMGIEDMVPMLWSTTKVGYDKDAKKGIKHWVKGKLHGYGHLEEIIVRRADRQVYNFKEGDFVDLHLNDIEDILLLVVQHKLIQLDGSDIVDLIVALRMFTRSLIIKLRVEDLQLGVESYQKKLNITTPQKTFPKIKFKELYTPLYKPPGVIYEDLNKQKRVMRADELYKFSNGTLKTVCDELHYRILDFRLGYNKEMSRRKWTAIDKRRSELMVESIDKQMRERRIIRNLERLVGARGGKSFWEEGDDFRVDVLRFHTCLTDILGFLETLEWWFEQDIDDEEEEEKDEEGEGGSEMEEDTKDGLAKQGNDILRM
ncbi:hypothetical protein Tco_0727157 [Tanacetum coccineum]|uniref:Uncharacterized protein n=1 Tax=Tanacetum coccineum TaxID=301880 RepID=A0ABQ4YIN1_9ASTR